MEIYILRHGEAAEPGTHGAKTDFDRPLTAEGKAAVRRVARGLRRFGVKPELILSSPLVRARETAEIVARELGLPGAVQLAEELCPDGSLRALVRRLRALEPQRNVVMLVGHEPYLSTLVSVLVTGRAGAGFTIKKGGVCKLVAESLKCGRCAKLEWLIYPALLA
ncbi:MAG: phosphohistidine phosphatase SixA [Verrucomicrobiae bacterium]|nr:phosphohistidine phosphatase SixA [Verrucomicrobiae bacterium]